MKVIVVAPLLLALAGCMGSPGYESVDADVFAERLAETEGAFLLDVRTAEEYGEAHLANATLIPHDEVATSADEVPGDKDTPIFVYCRTGNRSAEASEVLVEMGYTNVVHLDGGIEDWIDAGHPVVRPETV